MSKIDRAIEIVKSNPSASRSDLIAKFMSELGMSKAGATTYFYNATKGSDRPKAERKAKTAKVAKAPKASKSERQVELAKSVTATQLVKAAELARKRKEKEAESARIRAELDEFVNDIENYTFPHGTLSDVDQDRVDEIKQKNLKTMKKVQKTFIQDVA